jgi:uncharacterized protein YcnI
MKKILLALVTTVVLALPGTALAHVVVTPGEVETDSFVTFTMSVPTEKPVPTRQVRLLIPDGVIVYSVEPVYGWRISFVKQEGRVTSIVFRGNLPAERFQRFAFVAGTPEQPTTLVWKAIQTYRGGAVVRWTGEPGDEEASTTSVVQGLGEAHSD